MVTVHAATRDCATAWRVRDMLATHPLLAGTGVAIRVSASPLGILLEGWAQDERTCLLAVQLAQRSAGQRAIQCALQTKRANKKLAQRIFDNNEAQAQG